MASAFLSAAFALCVVAGAPAAGRGACTSATVVISSKTPGAFAALVASRGDTGTGPAQGRTSLGQARAHHRAGLKRVERQQAVLAAGPRLSPLLASRGVSSRATGDAHPAHVATPAGRGPPQIS